VSSVTTASRPAGREVEQGTDQFGRVTAALPFRTLFAELNQRYSYLGARSGLAGRR
jgi:hypothetical protein